MLPVLIDSLTSFTPISMEEMSAVKLMNRVDTKYLLTVAQLPEILTALQNDYFVQESHDKRYAHYKTLYYDTPDCDMYLAHHNRKLNRQKIRARIYCESQDAFCEIKNKNNKKRTKKKRVAIAPSQFLTMLQNDNIKEFVNKYLHYSIESLLPRLENAFDRITLVNYAKTERLTIDMGLHYFNHTIGNTIDIPDLVIIELKQDATHTSFFKSIMFEKRIRPKRISKYCLGTILTDPLIKQNRFKKKLRYIEKILDNE